jgi:hypothetical protein
MRRMSRLALVRIVVIVLLTAAGPGWAGKPASGDLLTIARLKYRGGGDWYNDPSMIPNLLEELRIRSGLLTADDQAIVSLSDDQLFSYPVLFITGHGNIRFDSNEAERLRTYLDSGGFLIADDDYNMDESFRREITRVFPDSPLVELPFSHPIYHVFYDFDQGPPKIHEHYKGAPKGFGIFRNGRLVVYYTYNSNISDGWADPDIHKDPPEIREEAFRMGINVIMYTLIQ